MRIVKLGNERYYIYGKDDEIFLSHELAKKGYSVKQIAQILGISIQKVRKYLQDCW